MTYPNEKRRWWLLLLTAGLLAAGCQPFKDEKRNPNEEEADASVDDDVDASSEDASTDGKAGTSGGRNADNGGSAGRGGSGASGSSGSSGTSGSAGRDSVPSSETDASLACRDGVPADAKRVFGTTNENTRWSGAIHLTGDFSLRGSGTKLTIDPGTQIFVEPDVLVEIGWNANENTIDAQGTERAPIKFCRTAKAAGNWKGVFVGRAVTPSSTLKYVVIDGAGAAETDALVLEKGILLDHVWVRDSAAHGVVASDFRDDSKSLSVTGSKLAPLVLTDAWAVQRLPPDSTFTGNTEDRARLTFANIAISVSFRDIGIPYQLERGLSLRSGGKLVVEPGVEWHVGLDQLIELGWNGSMVEVRLDGTADDPIVIRGVDARPGSWLGLAVNPSVVSTSTMKFVEIHHGGGNEGYGLTVSASITASDITLKDNAHGGFAIGSNGLQGGSGRFTVTGTKGAAGWVEPQALTTLPVGGSYKGNDSDWIEVDGGNITQTGTIPEVDVPFRVLETVTVRDGATVTIAPGVDFQMQSGVTWDIGWNGNVATFTAVGTAAKPIKFRGINDQPGFWNGISVGRNTTTSSRFEHVHIGNGGADSTINGNLRLNAPITVQNCRFYNSSRYGLVAEMEYALQYETLNTFEANVMGSVERK